MKKSRSNKKHQNQEPSGRRQSHQQCRKEQEKWLADLVEKGIIKPEVASKLRGTPIEKAGWLYKSYGKKGEKKYWFVLQGSLLKYYHGKASKYLHTGVVPRTETTPVGVYSLSNITVLPACPPDVKKCRDFTLEIKWKLKENRAALYLSAQSEAEKKDWLTKLGLCAELNDIGENDVDADKHRAILEVSKDVSLQELKIKYRKMALKHHPDRGGDVQMFKDMKTAYTMLVALKESELRRFSGRTSRSDTKEVLFEVDMRKEPEQGFGLNIQMTQGGAIAVKQVFGSTEEAGIVQIGDIIRAVNGVEIFGKPFPEIMAILKKVQIDEIVQFSLARTITEDGIVKNDHQVQELNKQTPIFLLRNDDFELEDNDQGRGRTKSDMEEVEYSFKFEAGPIGLDLAPLAPPHGTTVEEMMEYGGGDLNGLSVVLMCIENSQADMLQVPVGSVIRRINDTEVVDHAHTLQLIRQQPRPITIAVTSHFEHRYDNEMALMCEMGFTPRNALKALIIHSGNVMNATHMLADGDQKASVAQTESDPASGPHSTPPTEELRNATGKAVANGVLKPIHDDSSPSEYPQRGVRYPPNTDHSSVQVDSSSLFYSFLRPVRQLDAQESFQSFEL